MLIYYILYLILFVMSILSIVTAKSLNKYILPSTLLVLIVLAGIRDGTGTDYFTYLYLWNVATPIYEGLDYGYLHFEPGFRLLLSILKVFSESSIFFYTVLAAVPILYLYKALSKYQINYYVALFMYVNVFYLAYVFNGMGQAIIISIFLYYFDDFINLKTAKIFIISLIFVFIHKSAILILIAYVLYYSSLKLSNEFLLLIGIVFVAILYKTQALLLILNSLYPEFVYVYTQVFYETTSPFQLFTRTLILLILYWFGCQLKSDVFYSRSLKVYILGYIIYVIIYDYNILATRINMIYRAVEILMFSYAIVHSKNLFTRICIFLVVSVIYGYSFYKVIQLDDFFYRTTLW